MISERIKLLREKAGYSQSHLAAKLDVSRSAVNAWEMGFSAPTTQYIVAMSKLFHVSSDYILGIEGEYRLSLAGYSEEEIDLIYRLVKYIDEKKH